jgi:HSP20 family protein
MALVQWRDRELDPGDTLDWLQEQVDDLFQSFPRLPLARGLFDRAISPPVDVIETADHYVVECELPGMNQKDIDVSIASGVLTIKGEKKGPRSSSGTKVFRNETWQGAFQKTLSLPLNVQVDRIEAEYTDGVLRITVPKSESAKAKKIALKAS